MFADTTYTPCVKLRSRKTITSWTMLKMTGKMKLETASQKRVRRREAYGSGRDAVSEISGRLEVRWARTGCFVGEDDIQAIFVFSERASLPESQEE